MRVLCAREKKCPFPVCAVVCSKTFIKHSQHLRCHFSYQGRVIAVPFIILRRNSVFPQHVFLFSVWSSPIFFFFLKNCLLNEMKTFALSWTKRPFSPRLPNPRPCCYGNPQSNWQRLCVPVVDCYCYLTALCVCVCTCMCFTEMVFLCSSFVFSWSVSAHLCLCVKDFCGWKVLFLELCPGISDASFLSFHLPGDILNRITSTHKYAV